MVIDSSNVAYIFLSLSSSWKKMFKLIANFQVMPLIIAMATPLSIFITIFGHIYFLMMTGTQLIWSPPGLSLSGLVLDSYYPDVHNQDPHAVINTRHFLWARRRPPGYNLISPQLHITTSDKRTYRCPSQTQRLLSNIWWVPGLYLVFMYI